MNQKSAKAYINFFDVLGLVAKKQGMKRKQFLKTIITGGVAMTTLSAFNRFTSDIKEDEQLMPVLFIGHGSPMNGIEDNEFSRRWTQMAKEIPTPKAVLVVSAHWLSKGTRITANAQKGYIDHR